MLALQFSTRAGRVEVSCDESYETHLRALSTRFGSAWTVNRLTFDLEVDDLLVNLNELARWPSTDTDVRWQAELLDLVEGNARDAVVLEERLRNPDLSPEMVGT
jgi:hypothetical protein